VPAHIGLAHYLLGLGEYKQSIEAAENGLRIAEGTEYVL
jgi:ATP/maltotriose-dependent transcriptional regulator MalT